MPQGDAALVPPQRLAQAVGGLYSQSQGAYTQGPAAFKNVMLECITYEKSIHT